VIKWFSFLRQIEKMFIENMYIENQNVFGPMVGVMHVIGEIVGFSMLL